MKNSLHVGLHRPVYLWAGPGTIRMNKLKFMGTAVDEAVHREAHTAQGARRMKEAGFNWAYLTYNWGFPPEIEQEDWQEFCRAVQVYHQEGLQVFGYIQTSNCVYQGSYQDKDWYAQDSHGRKFYYYTGRYRTCWSHPEWLDHLKEMVAGVVEAGADGVFFDNPWHGSQPLHLGGAWLGGAGCYCPRCRKAFREASGGLDIPAEIDPEREKTSRRYLRWRANQVTNTLRMLAGYARSLQPQVLVSCNNFDAILQPNFISLGIDLEGLAQVQDILMIEDYGLPRWEPGENRMESTLVNNALTLRTASALTGNTPVSSDPYDQGIGFDSVYPTRRFVQGLTEAAACGAMMVVKGTEFVEQGQFTLLTASTYQEQRQALGKMHHWLEEHSSLYQDRQNTARIGLLYPGESMTQHWDRLAPMFFSTGQSLTMASVAWKVIKDLNTVKGLDVLLVFENRPDLDRLRKSQPQLRQVFVPSLPEWTPDGKSILATNAYARRLLGRIIAALYRAYFGQRWARSLGDRFRVAQRFVSSPFFRLPPAATRDSLLAALGDLPFPRLTSHDPILIESWQSNDPDVAGGLDRQVHLVNYASQPQEVEINFGATVYGKLLSPERPDKEFIESRLSFNFDVYSVIIYNPQPKSI